VQKILGEKREVLNTLAKLLLEKEIIQGDEMRALMGKSKPAVPALPGGPKGELPSPQPAA
jgi:ATP-dependent Zn protease